MSGLDLNKLIDTFTAFVETKIALLKWDAQGELHVFLSKAIILMLLFTAVGLGIIFLSFSLAISINFWMSSVYLGYLAVALVYFLFALLIFFSKKSIESHLQRRLNQAIEPQKVHKNE